MNSEFTQELEEEFRVLVELLSQHTVALTGMTDSINKITTTVVNANSSVTDYNNSQKKNVDAIKQNNVGSTVDQVLQISAVALEIAVGQNIRERLQKRKCAAGHKPRHTSLLLKLRKI